MTYLQKLPKNVRYLGKLIVAKGFKKLPKVQKIAQSGHTGHKRWQASYNPTFRDNYQEDSLKFGKFLADCRIHYFAKKSGA